MRIQDQMGDRPDKTRQIEELKKKQNEKREEIQKKQNEQNSKNDRKK
jgi:hypothetical protein